MRVPGVRVGVSACLLGARVRYDGDHRRDAWICDQLASLFELVEICPELELGLGVPREKIRIEGDASSPHLVAVESRRDLTSAMNEWADRRIDTLPALAGYVWKSGSPSCGPRAVPRYGTDSALASDGVGFFARALQRRFPELPVEDEVALADLEVRASFVDRVLAHHRAEATRRTQTPQGGRR